MGMCKSSLKDPLFSGRKRRRSQIEGQVLWGNRSSTQGALVSLERGFSGTWDRVASGGNGSQLLRDKQ